MEVGERTFTRRRVSARAPIAAERRRAWSMPASTRKKVVAAVLLLQDIVLLATAMLLATVIRFGSLWPRAIVVDDGLGLFFPQVIVLLLPVWLVVFAWNRLYDYDSLSWGSGEMGRIANGVTLGLVAVMLAGYALKLPDVSRGWIVLAWLLAVALVGLGRLGLRGLMGKLRVSGALRDRALIVGANDEARLLVTRVVGSVGLGVEAEGYVSDGPGALDAPGLPRLGGLADLRQLVRRLRIDRVLVASSDLSHNQIARVLRAVGDLPVDVRVSSGLVDILGRRLFVRQTAGIPMVGVKPISLSRRGFVLKRAFDIVVAAGAVLVLSPLMLAAAVLVKLTSPGPVLYRQDRIGQGGSPFVMLKFRSMKCGCGSDEHRRRVVEQIAMGSSDAARSAAGEYKAEDDPRMTSAGKWMRRYSIDELPQLFNVLKGDMSLVGPRPPLQYEVEAYEDWMMPRLDALPGVTGLWQVSGRADLPYKEMVQLDLFYLQNWSLRFDLGILLHTIPVVLFPKGAY